MKLTKGGSSPCELGEDASCGLDALPRHVTCIICCRVFLQDFRLSEQVAKAGCACVVAVNKWDVVPEKVCGARLTSRVHVPPGVCLQSARIVVCCATKEG